MGGHFATFSPYGGSFSLFQGPFSPCWGLLATFSPCGGPYCPYGGPFLGLPPLRQFLRAPMDHHTSVHHDMISSIFPSILCFLGMQIDSILNVSDIYNVHNSEWSLCEGRCSEDIVLCKNNRTACFFVDPCVGSTGTAGGFIVLGRCSEQQNNDKNRKS